MEQEKNFPAGPPADPAKGNEQNPDSRSPQQSPQPAVNQPDMPAQSSEGGAGAGSINRDAEGSESPKESEASVLNPGTSITD